MQKHHYSLTRLKAAHMGLRIYLLEVNISFNAHLIRFNLNSSVHGGQTIMHAVFNGSSFQPSPPVNRSSNELAHCLAE